VERYLESEDARGSKIVFVLGKIMIDMRWFLGTGEPPHSRAAEGKNHILDQE
jgi:hypothetical protein